MDSNEDIMHDPIMDTYSQHVLCYIVQEFQNVTVSGNRDKITVYKVNYTSFITHLNNTTVVFAVTKAAFRLFFRLNYQRINVSHSVSGTAPGPAGSHSQQRV